ncbi:protein-L-isoaspartate O-methyltransferase family protein [Halalkalirubrum salinum]|uniref:protein-L-isoaspartate O-methyltransferase family protein n=1 Tax=Halalkalirubrum salinum TaxID=2563889 RepID=UPI0010FB349E|nr:protein-L-isoaspartate O-methyltransferase [Halalkalirubrum salinum]
MDRSTLREDMIDSLEYGLEQPLSGAVLTALRSVPREAFVPESPYQNRSSEVAGTRVLAPGTVAALFEPLSLTQGCSVLIVGAGVGYTAAIAAELAGETAVHAIDIDRSLVHRARTNLADAGYDGVLVDRADGANGLAHYAPFDRILIEAAVVRPPTALQSQLAPGGRIVFPKGTGAGEQPIVAMEANADGSLRSVGEFATGQFRPLLAASERSKSRPRNRMHREDAEFAEQGYFAKHGWEHEWIDWDDRL